MSNTQGYGSARRNRQIQNQQPGRPITESKPKRSLLSEYAGSSVSPMVPVQSLSTKYADQVPMQFVSTEEVKTLLQEYMGANVSSERTVVSEYIGNEPVKEVVEGLKSSGLDADGCVPITERCKKIINDCFTVFNQKTEDILPLNADDDLIRKWAAVSKSKRRAAMRKAY